MRNAFLLIAVSFEVAPLRCWTFAADPSLSDFSKESSTVEKKQQEEDRCTLYLAQSSIPGAGLGVFTNVGLAPGQFVGEPDLSLILLWRTDDESFSSPNEENEELSLENASSPWTVMSHYAWHPEYPEEYSLCRTTPKEDSKPCESVDVLSLPVGALSNFLYFGDVPFNVVGAHHSQGEYDHNDYGPGRGASTRFVSKPYVSTRWIEAGEELWIDYGEQWRENFLADDDYQSRQTGVTDIVKELTELKLIEDQEAMESVMNLLRHTVAMYDPMMASLLPSTVEQLQLLSSLSNSTEKKILKNHSLKDRGRCMSHLRSDRSTVPYAGRGAFATQLLSAGEVVVPVPLIPVFDYFDYDHFYNHTVTTHNPSATSTPSQKESRSQPKAQPLQLIVNYCFLNPSTSSSMLLCPTTHAALINHAPLLSSSNDVNNEGFEECHDEFEHREDNDRSKEANVYLRWASSDWDPTTQEFLDLSIDEMKRREVRGLTLEVVALRDIDEGEEVFLDYGPAWEEAWKRHVASWDFDVLRKEPSPLEFNTSQPVLLVVDEDEPKSVMYPSNLGMFCLFAEVPHVHFNDDNDLGFWESYHEQQQQEQETTQTINENDNRDWMQLPLQDRIERFSVPWSDDDNDGTLDYWPCDVVQREEIVHEPSSSSSYLYTVRIRQAAHSETLRNEPVYVTGVPRHVIRFFEKPGTSDQFTPGAFRHPIGLPDHLLPDRWRALG